MDLLHDLPETDANAALAALSRQGIAATKHRVVRGGQTQFKLTVDRRDAAQAWRVLRDENLPRPRRRGLKEVFGKSTLIPTPTQQRALMQHALSDEVAGMLLAMPGVREANLRVVLPDKNSTLLDTGDKPQARAAAVLRVVHNFDTKTTSIQRLIASSVDGLAPEHVAVVMHRDPRPSGKRPPLLLSSVGPFRVAADSKPLLLGVLSIALALVITLVLAVIFLLWRTRRALAVAEAMAARLEQSTSSSLELLEQSVRRKTTSGTWAG